MTEKTVGLGCFLAVFLYFHLALLKSRGAKWLICLCAWIACRFACFVGAVWNLGDFFADCRRICHAAFGQSTGFVDLFRLVLYCGGKLRSDADRVAE